MTRTVACCAAVMFLVVPIASGPTANARGEGDTHITSVGSSMTIDCNNATLFVNGSWNTIYAAGTCYAIAVQGSGNIITAETVTDDITVYGWNQTVMYRNGDPYVLDRGRELGMVNNINRIP
jgi:hypothetical protein